MNKHPAALRFTIALSVMLFMVSPLKLNAQAGDVNISIYMRGVYETKVSLLALTPAGTFKSIKERQGVKDGQIVAMEVPGENLPGEFFLRFDYKENATSTPYPCEKYMFIGKQDLELSVNPKYCNHPDSSRFQKGELENAAFSKFSAENAKLKEKLGLLQNFLMSYDEQDSKFYKQGVKEYEKRRSEFNQWLKETMEQDTALFVGTMYNFQYVPEIPWEGTEEERIYSMIGHYFNGMDLNDSHIIKVSAFRKWMDQYVNLYGTLSTSYALRDSLFPLAGKRAIEYAKTGHPLVYGWMVDYFYRGYEANAIDAGMKVLEPYLDDPHCLTTKRQEIIRRLEGMETLVAGTIAPEIVLKYKDGTAFELSKFETDREYIVLLFWSADCNHCVELTDKLYRWQQQADIQQKIIVVPISLDETETEVIAWEKKRGKLDGWKHLRAKEGVNSKVASDYYVLATPVMVLLNAKTREIIAMPNTLHELKSDTDD